MSVYYLACGVQMMHHRRLYAAVEGGGLSYTIGNVVIGEREDPNSNESSIFHGLTGITIKTLRNLSNSLITDA